MHSAVIYQKISNSVGRNDDFLAKARKLHVSTLPTSLDIFDIWQRYIPRAECNTILTAYTLYRHLQ